MITPMLYMPEGYKNMSEGSTRNICSVCGSGGTDCMPEYIWGLQVSEACKIRAYMYHFAESTVEAKEKADRVFLNNMIRIIDRNTSRFLINCGLIRIKNPLFWLRRRAAYAYYERMRKFGGPIFWIGKNDSKNLGKG